MIPFDEQVEMRDSKPLARQFRTLDMAHAYILGLEDAKRCLGAQRLLGTNAWESLNTLWIHTKINHHLDIIDPPDLKGDG